MKEDEMNTSVICMERMRNAYKFLVGVNLGDLGIGGGTILKWILRNWV
jgi:hypothetical protein